MIVLDTNVLSEAMKPAPNTAVLAWLDTQVAETLFISAVTLAEMQYGVLVLPEGRRRDRLATAIGDVATLFADRILPFDMAAAQHYATLAVRARSRGLGFPIPDGYIAAIAASRGFAVATRDTSAFAAAGLSVINPWQ